jgi:hypothetical protein
MWHDRRLVTSGPALACAVSVVIATGRAWGDNRRPVALSKGPYLTELSESGVDVRFELDGASPASVEVRGANVGAKADPPVDAGASARVDAGAARVFEDRAPASWHVVSVRDLAPGARYGYVVRVAGRTVGQGAFTTAAPANTGAPTKFLVYGDDRTDATAHAAVVRALGSSPCDFLVNTGDLVEDGGRAENWQSFFDIEAPLLRDHALFVAIGNHELYDDRAGANFARYFGFSGAGGAPQPYGTAHLGNVRLFFLNSMHDWSSGTERDWLERELGKADGEAGVVWRIAVMHHGPWSSGPHGPSTEIVAAHVPELLAAHHVDLVLSGHDHIYERGDAHGMKYVISGGGGAPLYRTVPIATTRKAEATYHFIELAAGGDALRLVARRIDGSVLDQCGFKKGGGWDCDPPATRASELGPHEQAPAPHEASVAAASLAPTQPPSSSSQCGCEVPGAGATSSGAVALGVAMAMVRAARRKRSAGPRRARACGPG